MKIKVFCLSSIWISSKVDLQRVKYCSIASLIKVLHLRIRLTFLADYTDHQLFEFIKEILYHQRQFFEIFQSVCGLRFA